MNEVLKDIEEYQEVYDIAVTGKQNTLMIKKYINNDEFINAFIKLFSYLFYRNYTEEQQDTIFLTGGITISINEALDIPKVRQSYLKSAVTAYIRLTVFIPEENNEKYHKAILMNQEVSKLIQHFELQNELSHKPPSNRPKI